MYNYLKLFIAGKFFSHSVSSAILLKLYCTTDQKSKKFENIQTLHSMNKTFITPVGSFSWGWMEQWRKSERHTDNERIERELPHCLAVTATALLSVPRRKQIAHLYLWPHILHITA